MSLRQPEFEPIYYCGWIIQPVPDGLHVYSRVDTERGPSVRFGFIYEAEEYIKRMVGLGG